MAQRILIKTYNTISQLIKLDNKHYMPAPLSLSIFIYIFCIRFVLKVIGVVAVIGSQLILVERNDFFNFVFFLLF